MSDNYWKERYKETWSQSSKRENTIKENIERETGFKVEAIGLGAGSTEFLSGSAASRGFTKGGSDFRIQGTNIELEITGDLTGKVSKSQSLWVRPDKIHAAMKNPQSEKWVIHHLTKDNTLRAIPLNKEFIERFSKGEFKTAHPRIRGTVETYSEILANDRAVRPFDEFLNRLKELKGKS